MMTPQIPNFGRLSGISPAGDETPLATALDAAEWEAVFKAMKQPAFRARQVITWLYRRNVTSFEAMANLPKFVREVLADRFQLHALTLKRQHHSPNGQATKWLFAAADGALIESVSIFSSKRHTVCVSSQVGCAMGCAFCATGLDGLQRNLASFEIAEQILHAQRLSGVPVTNVVFMGMGEPMANLDAVLESIRILNAPDRMNIGARKITVSTIGIIPGILRLAEFNRQIELAVSLHAPTDALRKKLVPVARTTSITEILAAVKTFIAATNRQVTFEYILLKGMNDQPEQANRLADLLAGMNAKVNLIPYNRVPGLPYSAPSRSDIDTFLHILAARRITATIRWSKGNDVDAACGQLRRHSHSSTSEKKT